MSKQSVTEVREDRIPILSKVIFTGEFMTESQLCPPGPSIKEMIEKKL